MYTAFWYPRNEQKNDKYFFKSSQNVQVRKTDVILYDVAAKMCQFDVTSVYANIVQNVISSILKQRFYICKIQKKTIGSMREKARKF